MRPALAAVLALLPALAAAERVPVRTGDHPGHGRLVFDWPAPPAYSLEQQGDRVLLRFTPGSEVASPRRLPRNLLGIEEEGSGLLLTLRPGARARHYRLGRRVVVDLLDPPPAGTLPATDRGDRHPRRGTPRGSGEDARAPVPDGPKPPAPQPVAEPPGPSPQAAQPSAGPPGRGAAPAPEPKPEPAFTHPLPAPRQPDTSAAMPPRTLPPARLLTAQKGPPSLLLPFPAGTGAAILRRGGEVLALFDSAETPDLRPLRGNAAFGGLEAETLPGATLLRLPLPPPARLQARRDAAGWVLQLRPALGPGEPSRSGPALELEAEAGPPPRLLLRVAAPGRVVPVQDPETGLPLLLGTLREGTEAMPVGRRLPELDLPPTMLGAAVLARSDHVALQPGAGRFAVTAAGEARLALESGVAQPAPAPTMTRSFDLPALPPAELLARLQVLQAGIAAAPPLGRLAQRRAAGEALLALGLPQEAQAMLALGFGEDPRAAADPRYAALAGAAALLAGRLAEAGALRAPAWADSDEATLWRAALAAAEEDWRGAGPGFAATVPLLLGYPENLRARLLPVAALALAESGEHTALRQVLAWQGGEELALPRAMLAEVEGKAEAALEGYDRVAAGRDRQARARAIRRAVELRLASGRIDASQAARALEAALLAWRGDAMEIGTRLRIAALRHEAGDARGALALLRETAAMAPERMAVVQPAMQESFLAALVDSPPLAAVTLFDAYPEMLPADPRGDQAVLVLAERLQSLDLGDRAAALLRRAMERAVGGARAALGLRLAAMRLAEGDATGAQAALSESEVEGAPAELARDRAILSARAEARRGRRAEAAEALRALGPAGSEALSELLAESSDWMGAAAALNANLAAALPPGPAPVAEAHRRLLLRQAALLALAGDEPALAALRAAHAARMGEGPLAEAFALLTADPLRGLADLPRLQRELQLFRTLPTRLEALRAGAPLTR